MNIHQLSANIDLKLQQLELKIDQLQGQYSKPDGDKQQLLRDIDALSKIKAKLQKSRQIMWQAHELQQGADQQKLNNNKRLGIGLCAFSVLGLAALIFALIQL